MNSRKTSQTKKERNGTNKQPQNTFKKVQSINKNKTKSKKNKKTKKQKQTQNDNKLNNRKHKKHCKINKLNTTYLYLKITNK